MSRRLFCLNHKNEHIRQRIAHALDLAVVAVFLSYLMVGTIATASEKEQIALRNDPTQRTHMVILDASSSMWAKLQGTPKYEILKRELPNVLEKLPPKISYGMMVFGAQQRKGCKDVSYPLKVNRSKKINSAQILKNYQPKGRAPISFTLDKAARSLDYTKKKANIILLADGYDTCRSGPCTTVKTLKKKAQDLKVNVIGINLSKKNIKNYQCLTSHTGGTFANITDAKSLKNALSKAFGFPSLQHQHLFLDFLADYKKRKDRPKLKEEADGPSRVKLAATLSKNSAFLEKDIQWRIYKKGAKSKSKTSDSDVIKKQTASPVVYLEPGHYVVEARYGKNLKERKTVSVPPQGMKAYVINLKAGTLKLQTSRVTAGPILENVFYEIYKTNISKGEKNVFARSFLSRPEFLLPAGDYNIIARYGSLKLEQPVTLTAGKIFDLRLAFNIGRLSLSSLSHENGTPLSQVVYNIYHPASKLYNNSSNYPLLTTVENDPVISLPEGQYLVTAEYKHLRLQQKIEVRVNQTAQTTLNFNTGTLSIESFLSNAPQVRLKDSISYRIYRLDENAKRREVVRTSQPNPKYLLTTGRYLIKGRYGTINADIEQTLTITPGKEHIARLAHNAGRIKLSLTKAPQSFPIQNVFWKIFANQDLNTSLWNSNRPVPELILKADQYHVVAEYKGQSYEKSFTVKPGDDISVNILAQAQNMIR
ncbi:MAG: hypothetical protein AAF228_00270 [Pseudomonadota bacterium]